VIVICFLCVVFCNLRCIFTQQPENAHYARSLELASKGPELNTEVHKHGLGPQPLGGTAGPPSTSAKITLRKLLSSYNKLFLFALFLVFIKFR
jgi:hypothetical protein